VHDLSQRFGEPVSDGLGHDLLVVIVVRLVLAYQLVEAEARRHRKHAQVVCHAAGLGCDEVGHCEVAAHTKD
jgi:hypothetical protein